MANFYKQSLSCQISTLAEIYENDFGCKTDGVYVDVGAHNGYYCSNTWGLAEAGWRGILYEPMPGLAYQCRGTYLGNDKITVVEAAVGAYKGTARLWTDGNPTIDLETARKGPWGPSYDLSHFINIPVVCLNESLVEHDFPHNFDVLSIDVEGAELQVLDGIDFSYWKPRMVILETCKDHPIESYHIHTDALVARMDKEGFSELYHDAINSIYVRYP